MEDWCRLCLDWNGGRLDEEFFDSELCEELECIVFSFLEGVEDSSCSRCLCLAPETIFVISLFPLKLLVLELLVWFSDEFDDNPGMLAYFVVSGCNGGSITVDVGVSTTAALLVIVNVAALSLFSKD